MGTSRELSERDFEFLAGLVELEAVGTLCGKGLSFLRDMRAIVERWDLSGDIPVLLYDPEGKYRPGLYPQREGRVRNEFKASNY